MNLRDRLLQIFTEDDGVDLCWGKCASTFALTAYVLFAGWTMYHSDDGTLVGLFNSFGLNLAIVLGGCGALIGLKQATQVKDVPPS